MTQSLAMVSSTVLCPKLGACAVSLSPSATPHTKIQRFHLSSWLSPMGRSLFSPWNGLKHLGISTKPKPLFHIDRKGRCKGKLVYASLFGVGAPEALVIGVVALLVFGPKGLAEVARNLGKTLRTFQPTIRELQDVSREFKSTLEREIGLDDISSPTQNPYNSNFQNTTSTPSSTDSTKSSPIAVDPGPYQGAIVMRWRSDPTYTYFPLPLVHPTTGVESGIIKEVMQLTDLNYEIES
ncbi:sec-independent protein translocase protein TATB, chloroplastic isoform X4 [Lotus japonicus]|uniref:sec-independent protein translocase protein TATB, chloroplastic isoform X4 n=1 Tax=Lotus japonicus TaxID=34305 RepID=UPI00258B62CC|nr:sec-independent protein translocase protein TATB, chloroplastic isoform X4 [Lotus japonicus]